MIRLPKPGLAAGALLLTGCMAAPGMDPAPPIADNCPAQRSRGWQATLDAMPGPGKTGPTLTIAGEVDLPSPGWRVMLEPGPADRMLPPSQRFRLIAAAPGGMVAQVISPTQVTYRAKADYPAYRSIIILCGDRSLATITDIAVVH